MNYRGSSKHLLRNAKSALLAAIEIYNKPNFSYRDECFVILLLNAWELILKSLISKHRGSIYYPKKRREAYRTFSIDDAFNGAEKFFPKDVNPIPVRGNLNLLSTYRNNAIHFYNEPNFSILIYALAQTSIINFKDILKDAFNIDLGRDIAWQLMPIGINPPIDPVQYMSEASATSSGGSSATRQFITAIAANLKEVSDAGADTGRLMTIFKVTLESVKKVGSADLVVGVAGSVGTSDGPLVITKMKDPNITHPLRQKEVLGEINTLYGKKFTSNTFQAICHQYSLKENPLYCWRATGGVLIRYSNDVVAYIRRLSASDIRAALMEYRQRNGKRILQ